MNDTRTPELAELSDQAIDRMEQTLLARIAAERHIPASARAARSRRRTWLTVSGVAAAFVAGILVAPPLINAVSFTLQNDTGTEVAPIYDGVRGEGTPDGGVTPPTGPMPGFGSGITDGNSGTDRLDVPSKNNREIVANASASVRVDEIATASEAIARIARDLGGYVETTNIGQVSRSAEMGIIAPTPPGGDWGWVSIRVPSASLDEAISKLSSVGEVRASSKSQHDVTSYAIDLRARVDALQASVERLTELMAQTGSVAELITAETALSERQAQLESYTQQLAALEQQVAMSTLYVELERIMPVTKADPAGFADGLRAGWDGMIVSLNALVVAAGFLLPWVVVLGVATLVVWLIVRSRRNAGTRAAVVSAEKSD